MFKVIHKNWLAKSAKELDNLLLMIYRQIPLSLTLSRALIIPLMIVAAYDPPAHLAFAGLLLFAFVSDIFDGVIARRMGVATAGLRRLDSAVDTLFYVSALWCVWRLYPNSVRDHAKGLIVLFTLEVARYAFDFYKFRREASYHMWSSKLWGIIIFLAFFAVLVTGTTEWFFAAAVYAGVLNDLEGLAISWVLPVWTHDVPTIFHAIALRTRNRKRNLASHCSA